MTAPYNLFLPIPCEKGPLPSKRRCVSPIVYRVRTTTGRQSFRRGESSGFFRCRPFGEDTGFRGLPSANPSGELPRSVPFMSAMSIPGATVRWSESWLFSIRTGSDSPVRPSARRTAMRTNPKTGLSTGTSFPSTKQRTRNPG